MWHFEITEWAVNRVKERGHVYVNKNRNDRSNIVLHEKGRKKMQFWVSLSAITKPGVPPFNSAYTWQVNYRAIDKLDRTGNFTDMFTHALSDKVLVSVSATRHSLHL